VPTRGLSMDSHNISSTSLGGESETDSDTEAGQLKLLEAQINTTQEKVRTKEEELAEEEESLKREEAEVELSKSALEREYSLSRSTHKSSGTPIGDDDHATLKETSTPKDSSMNRQEISISNPSPKRGICTTVDESGREKCACHIM